MFGFKRRAERMDTPFIRQFTRYLGELLTVQKGYTSFSDKPGVLEIHKGPHHIKITIEEMPHE